MKKQKTPQRAIYITIESFKALQKAYYNMASKCKGEVPHKSEFYTKIINKGLLPLLICAILLFFAGCSQLKPKGISVGAMYINAEIGNSTSHADVTGIAPIMLLNFEFE